MVAGDEPRPPPVPRPLSGALTHALARVSVTAVPRLAPDGRRRVTVRARVRGRSVARPLLPLATAVPGRRARRACAALERAAAAWNAQVPELVRKDGERLGAELADALLVRESATGPAHAPRRVEGARGK
ncbi:hypothetical protein ABZ400_20340 [Streptomyces sp. NPDC005897]|uniref:hypothetical protein n=1 Tax=Streptomyces sp. NPDC005897 TaxID=3157081 RepID=UPI0033D942CB